MAVLFITTNTIKLTIYSRRDEIEIYKLVGATDWFVKLPYLIEGAIEGLLGGILSYIILLIIYSVFSVKTVQVFGLPIIDFAFLSYEQSIYIIVLSLVLGFVGGLIAIVAAYGYTTVAQKSEAGSQISEVRGQKTETRIQKSEVRY